MGFYTNLKKTVHATSAVAGIAGGPIAWGILVGTVAASVALEIAGDDDDTIYDKCPVCGESGSTKIILKHEVKACFSCHAHHIDKMARLE